MILIIHTQNAVTGIVCLPMCRYRKVHAFGAPKMTLRLENLMNLNVNLQAANFESLLGSLYIQKWKFSGVNWHR